MWATIILVKENGTFPVTVFLLLFTSFVPESARWLAIHGRVETQKSWKRIIPCNRSDPLNDTSFIKKKSDELKCTGCDIGFQNINTNRQRIVNNDIIEIEINNISADSTDFENAGNGINLPGDQGKVEDYSKCCDDSLAGAEHKGIMQDHITSVENRGSKPVCKQDGGDSEKSQNGHYLKASDCSTAEVSHLLTCEITNDCSEKINGTHRADKRRVLKLTESDEVADVTLMHPSTSSQSSSSSLIESDHDEKSYKESKEMLEGYSLHIINSGNDMMVDSFGSPYLCEIRKETGDAKKSSHRSSKSDRLNCILTETAQELEDDEGKSVSVQCMVGTADKTRMQCKGCQGVHIGKTLAVDDNTMNTVPVRSTCNMIVVPGEEYRTENKTEVVEINSIVTEDSGTTSNTLCDGAVRMNTSNTDVGHDGEVICSDMSKTCKINKNKTVIDSPKMMDKTAKRTGFFELFRSTVLRKHNLIMVFVW